MEVREKEMENKIHRVWDEEDEYAEDFDRSKIENSILEAAKKVGGLRNNLESDSMLRRVVSYEGEDYDEIIAAFLTNIVISTLNGDKTHWTPLKPPSKTLIKRVIAQVMTAWKVKSVPHAFTIYREGIALRKKGLITHEEFADVGDPGALLDCAKKQYESYGIYSIEDMNRIIKKGGFLGLVEKDSQRYEQEVQVAVNKFCKFLEVRTGKRKVLVVAGPSSSGKTTTSEKLCEKLQELGIPFLLFPCDHYFYSLCSYPTDWWGYILNLELPHALNLKRLNQDIGGLLDGRTINPLDHDFLSGMTTDSEKSMFLPEDGVLIIDSLHGLYLAKKFGLDAFTVYIECLTALIGLNHSDVRLLRRAVRDANSRGSKARKTVEYWPNLRDGECKVIMPFQNTADAKLNGGLVYDVPLMWACLQEQVGFRFDRIDHYPDQGRVEIFKRADRISKFLKSVRIPRMKDVSGIPVKDLSREFIGKFGLS